MLNLNKNNKKGRQQSLLVFLSNGFELLAAVVEVRAEVSLAAVARSNKLEPADALMEVVSKLAVSYGKLPSEAILVHSHAVPAILDLPIDNVANLDKKKVQELIRWEMESIFSDLVPHENLGWLMINLLYMTEEQRDQLVMTMESENKNASKKARLGEMAIQADIINRNQLEHCLSLQDQLQAHDQRIRCGYNQLSTQEGNHWIATAFSEAARAAWSEAFQSLSKRSSLGKIRLKSIYPFISTATQLIPGYESEENLYILELHRPYLTLLHYQEGVLKQCLSLGCSNSAPMLNDVEALLQNADIVEGREVYVLVTDSNRTQLRDELDDIQYFKFIWLEHEIKTLKNIPGDLSTSSAFMIAGAAKAYVNKTTVPVAVEGQEPPPPFYKNSYFKYGVAAILAIVLIVGIERGVDWHEENLRTELADLEDKVKKQRAVKLDVRNSEKAQEELKVLQGRYEGVQAIKKLIESVLIARKDFMDEFLDVITRNLNDKILINRIQETNWNVFSISGWAVDQTSIDYFGQGLSRDLTEWNMIITDNPSNLARNENGVPGYEFKFIIKKNMPAKNLVSR